MATHSSVLAWRIPGTGEPGGLPSLGSHRVGCDWNGLAAAAAERSVKWRKIMWGRDFTDRGRTHCIPLCSGEGAESDTWRQLRCRWNALEMLWGGLEAVMRRESGTEWKEKCRKPGPTRMVQGEGLEGLGLKLHKCGGIQEDHIFLEWEKNSAFNKDQRVENACLSLRGRTSIHFMYSLFFIHHKSNLYLYRNSDYHILEVRYESHASVLPFPVCCFQPCNLLKLSVYLSRSFLSGC